MFIITRFLFLSLSQPLISIDSHAEKMHESCSFHLLTVF